MSEFESRAGITDAEPCPYLPDRQWQSFILQPAGPLSAEIHEAMLDQGFRRMGQLLFRPLCPTCSACRSLRLDVNKFALNKSRRRLMRRNADLTVELAPPQYSEEKRALLERYLDARHVGPMVAEEQSMLQYMFSGTDHSYEFSYRDADERLIGLGLFDLTANVGSSVYFYFEPAESRRSLGTYSMLREIEFTKNAGARWFHPGFFIEGCAAMDYKARFQPAEIMDENRLWGPFST